MVLFYPEGDVIDGGQDVLELDLFVAKGFGRVLEQVWPGLDNQGPYLCPMPRLDVARRVTNKDALFFGDSKPVLQEL